MTRIKIGYRASNIIIFGDLHANWEALSILQQTEPNPLAIFCLGDLVGYGPDTKRCLDAIRSAPAYVIGGRHDRAVAGQAADTLPPGPNADLLHASWAHARSVLSPADRDYLASLPESLPVELAGVRFYLTRLPPDDDETETRMLITLTQAELRDLFGHLDVDVVLLGGPHIPALRQVDGKLIICPGSLGQPRYGVPEPTFAVWRNNQAKIHHLHYNPSSTIRKLNLLPLAPEHRLRLQSMLQAGYSNK